MISMTLLFLVLAGVKMKNTEYAKQCAAFGYEFELSEN